MSTAASRNALDGAAVKKVTLYDGGGSPAMPSAAAGADGVTNPTLSGLAGYGMAFNGTTWDRIRNNTSLIAYASSARTATPTAYTFTNYNGHALMATLSVTAITGTPSVTVTIDGADANGTWRTLLTGAAITASGAAAIYKVGPSLAAQTNLVAQDYLPRSLRITPTHANSDSITYTAGVELI